MRNLKSLWVYFTIYKEKSVLKEISPCKPDEESTNWVDGVEKSRATMPSGAYLPSPLAIMSSLVIPLYFTIISLTVAI